MSERESTSVTLTPPSKKLIADFNRINFILAIGMLCILLPLFIYHYAKQRNETIATIESQVLERSQTLDGFLQQTQLYVQQLHGHMHFQLRHPPATNDLADLPLKPKQTGNSFSLDHITPDHGYQQQEIGNIFGTGALETYTQQHFAEFKAAQTLFAIFQSGHRAMPQLSWSYYQSASGFAAIYPWTTTHQMLDGPAFADVETLIENVLQMPFFVLGTPQNNPAGEAYWTPVYQDPAGKGDMITYAIPVTLQREFYGIVAADITLASLGQYLQELRSEQEQFVVFDAQNNPLIGITSLDLNQQLDTLELRPGVISSFSQQDHIVFATQLENAPLKLYYALPSRHLSPFSSSEFMTYINIVALFICLILLSYFMLKRRMIDPALALTEYIRSEAAHGKSYEKEVPDIWRPWFRAISDTLALKAVSANLPGAILQFRRHPDGTVQNIFVSDAVADIMGVSPQELKRNTDAWNKLTDPATTRQIGKVLNQAARDASPIQHEYKITTPEGKQKWLRFSANPRRDTDGFCMFEGLLLDITQVKKAELALRASETRLRDILERAPFALVISTLESGKVVYINPKGAQLFGIARDDLIGNLGNHSWHNPKTRKEIFERVQRGETVEDREVMLSRPDGGTFWATLSATQFAYLDEPCILFTYNDITNRKALEEDLKYLATTDPLTSALNRRAFMERGNFELARNKRYGGKLSVLLLDVDHFKRVNDSYGHAVGDDTLRQMTATLRHTLRETDLIGRLGGEEFAALLPHTPRSEAIATAERLCDIIRKTQITSGQLEFKITVSIGVTELLEGDNKLDQLLARADKGLYKAKHAGRDRVIFNAKPDTGIEEVKQG